MALRTGQNPSASKIVQSPGSGCIQERPAEAPPAGLEIAPDTLGPSLRRLISAGPEPRVIATVPVGCPLPMGDLVSYATQAEQELACTDCHYFRTVHLAEGGGPPRPNAPQVRYGFCTAPERASMALVSAEAIGSTTRPETDERVLACIRVGVTVAPTIAAMTGLRERVVWKAVRRLKADGVIEPGLRIHRAA